MSLGHHQELDVGRNIEFIQNKQSKQYETSRHSISN